MTHPAHFLAFVSLATTASILFVIAMKIGFKGRRTFFALSILLGAFSGVHSSYHLAEYLNMLTLADVILLPSSAFLFALFALYYLRSSWKPKKVVETEGTLIGN